MKSVSHLIHQLAAASLGCVVHVGAGTDLELYDDRPIRRLVLIEADPEAAAELARKAAGRRGVEVVAAAVTVDGGDLTWQRFNLPALNGPVDITPLMLRLPRLQRLSTLPMHGIRLESILPRAGEDARDDTPNVLVLDVPGQSQSLLGALDLSALHAVQWIVVRELRPFVEAGGPAFEALLGTLGQAHFERCEFALGSDDDPLWTDIVLRHDRFAARFGLAGALAGQAVSERDGALQQLRDQNDRIAAVQQELVEARARAEACAAAARDELDAARSKLEDAEALLGERDRRIESIEVQLRQQQADLEDAGERMRQAEADAGQLVRRTAELEARDREITALREQAQQIDGERLEAELQTLRQEKDRLAKEKRGLVDEIESLRRDLAGRDQRQWLIDREVQRAEAQLDLVKDVLLREKRF